MVETQRQYENFDDLEIINPRWDSNSFEFWTSLLETWKDKWVERKPDTKEGKKVFDYTDKNWWKWEIVVGKNWDNQYEIRVKKRILLPNWKMWWKTQKNETSVIAKDKKEFNQKLWSILDKTIWSKNRVNLKNTWTKIFEDLNKKSSDKQNIKSENKTQKEQKEQWEKKTDLKKKPIDLQFNEINVERQPHANLCDRESVEWRVQRCLRWTSITDAVEDRYWIPRWLLLAMAAQESYWDPTQINAWWDGWAGLLHIQATYARQYWLNVAKMTTSWSVDRWHSKELNNIKSQNNNDLKILSEYDERFNMLEAVDVSARFLLGEYININKSIPDNASMETWLKVASWYNSPTNTKDYWPTSYSKKVLYYWSVMNQVRWIKKPSWFKNAVLKEIAEWTKEYNINRDGNKNNKHTVTEDVKKAKEAIKNMNPSIDDKPVSIENYYKYWADQCNNYWLQEYIKYNKEHPYKK